MSEETKEDDPTQRDKAQTTIETGALSKEQYNTISSTNNKPRNKKKKPADINVDSSNSLKGTKNKFKNAYSSETLK